MELRGFSRFSEAWAKRFPAPERCRANHGGRAQPLAEGVLSQAEWEELREAFARRHVLTHNLGIADARYTAAGGTTPVGQRVQVTPTTAERALQLLERLVQSV